MRKILSIVIALVLLAAIPAQAVDYMSTDRRKEVLVYVHANITNSENIVTLLTDTNNDILTTNCRIIGYIVTPLAVQTTGLVSIHDEATAAAAREDALMVEAEIECDTDGGSKVVILPYPYRIQNGICAMMGAYVSVTFLYELYPAGY